MTTFIEIGEQIVNPAHIVRIRCEHALGESEWHWKFDLIDGMTASKDTTDMWNTAQVICWLGRKMREAREDALGEMDARGKSPVVIVEDLPPVPGMDAGEVK